MHGFSIFAVVRYIRDELLIVLGTSSSETVLPRLMDKLERLGVRRSVVGLVVPTGYSFNLDGTCIYLTMAAVFLAQATDTPMSLGQQLLMLAVLLLTSKGAAGVTGSGFIVLAGTLASVNGPPVAALALILGIDRFMSEARADEPRGQRGRDAGRRSLDRRDRTRAVMPPSPAPRVPRPIHAPLPDVEVTRVLKRYVAAR